MPKLTEALLKEGIKQENFLPAYCFYGEEAYLISHYTNLLAERLVGNCMPDFNLTQLAGENTTMAQVLEAADALPVMHHHRCVLVRDFLPTECSDDQLEQLASYLADPCPGNVMVFYYATVQPAAKGKWKTFLAALEKHGGVIKFTSRTAAELAHILCAGAGKRGCRMTARTANYLVECIGNDMNALLCELEKLCAYRNQGEITEKDVDMLCAKSLSASAFQICREINRKNSAAALGILEKLFRMREEPNKIMGALASSYNNAYRALIAHQAGIPLAAFGEALSLKNPGALSKSLGDARRLGQQKLERSIQLLSDYDKSLKCLPVDGKILLQQAVVGLLEIAKE